MVMHRASRRRVKKRGRGKDAERETGSVPGGEQEAEESEGGKATVSCGTRERWRAAPAPRSGPITVVAHVAKKLRLKT